MYKTPDGTLVKLFGPLTCKPTAEQVSSSTCKDMETNGIIQTETEDAYVYVDRAEDESVAIETEPLFFARPYTTNEHTDDTNSPNTANNTHTGITSGNKTCCHGKDNMISNERSNLQGVDKMQVTITDHIGLKEQMNFNTADNMQNQYRSMHMHI